MRRFHRILNREDGFTLIELMIVIVVLGVLASIAVPKISQVREKANIAVIKADLHNIQLGLELYYMEEGSYPDDGTDLTTLDEISISEFAQNEELDFTYEFNGEEYVVYIQYPASTGKYYFVKSGTGVSSADQSPAFPAEE